MERPIGDAVRYLNQDSPWKSVKEFVADAQRKALTVGGTGSKQEDELIFTFFEQKADLQPFKYVPFKGGGTVAANLVGRQIQASVNNPSEGLPHHPAKLRILATFAEKRHERFPDVPTMKELGHDISYQMMRGIFGPPKMPAEAREYYAGLMKKVFDLPDFQSFLTKNVLDPQYLAGDAFGRWVAKYHDVHDEVMREAGWVK